MGSIRNLIRSLSLPISIAAILSLCTHCGGGGTSDPALPSPPTITSQPQSQTVTAGQPAAFTVAATGTALSYQWKHDGASVGTNGSALNIPQVQASDAGTYTVMVSAAGGSVTSQAATLTVNPAPAGTYSISGSITGDGQQGALITLSGPVNATTTPNPGTYAFTNLPDGDYTLSCSQRGYTYTPTSLTLNLSGADLTQDFDSYRGVGTDAALERLWFADANHGWAVGSNTILFWDGLTWTPQSAASADLTCVSGSGPDDVWAVGNGGVILHWDSQSWTSFDSSTTENIHCVWSVASGNAWAGSDSHILHWDGQSWSQSPVVSTVTLSSILGIWANSTDVWAMDSIARLYRWNGSAWDLYATIPTSNPLYGFSGFSSSDIWAVGGGGTILHWTGQSLSVTDSFTTETLLSLWGTTSNNVWAVGTAGTLRHWTGQSWSTVASDSPYDLRSIHGTGADSVWVAGSRTLMKLH